MPVCRLKNGAPVSTCLIPELFTRPQPFPPLFPLTASAHNSRHRPKSFGPFCNLTHTHLPPSFLHSHTVFVQPPCYCPPQGLLAHAPQAAFYPVPVCVSLSFVLLPLCCGLPTCMASRAPDLIHGTPCFFALLQACCAAYACVIANASERQDVSPAMYQLARRCRRQWVWHGGTQFGSVQQWAAGSVYMQELRTATINSRHEHQQSRAAMRISCASARLPIASSSCESFRCFFSSCCSAKDGSSADGGDGRAGVE